MPKPFSHAYRGYDIERWLKSHHRRGFFLDIDADADADAHAVVKS
jgi:hypothetical protein